MTDTDAELTPAAERRIGTFLDGAMVDHDVPGLSVAVLDREGIRYADGFGARNVETRAPATPDTLYSVGSVTKTFTAIATLQLVERGELALDDWIGEYVDYWTDVPGDPITVEDLLSHSSGMPANYAGRRESLFPGTRPTSPLVSRADYVRHYDGAGDWRVPDPEGYLYSNAGYLVLGELVGAAAGRPYADHVESEIFAPLGMDRSQVGHGELSATDADAATGYTVEDGEPVAGEFDLEASLDPPYSAGGVLSSARDLAAAVRCLLNGGELDGTRILDAGTVEAMCTHQAPHWETVDGRRRGYGYGLTVREFAGGTLVGHTGTAPGVCRAFAGLVPERGVGVTLGVNTPDAPVGVFGQGVLAVLNGDSPGEVVPYLALQGKIDAVTGTYEGYRGGVTVTVERADPGGHLRVTYLDGPGWEFPAFPESVARDELRFYTVRNDGKREPVTFEDTDAGMVMQCNVDRLRRTGAAA